MTETISPKLLKALEKRPSELLPENIWLDNFWMKLLADCEVRKLRRNPKLPVAAGVDFPRRQCDRIQLNNGERHRGIEE